MAAAKVQGRETKMAATGETGQAEVQERVFALLADPHTHGMADMVRRIDTHCAAVFLAGPAVYKVKRAVQYPFLDFSTLEKRHQACLAELAVNHRNAPDLYLGVIPITEQDGALRLGGEGSVVEWAVHLRRFDENATLDRLAGEGRLGEGLIQSLADAVLSAHTRAPIVENPGHAAHLRAILTDTVAELRAGIGLLDRDHVEGFAEAAGIAFDTGAPLLLQRAAQGFLRRCHGDLHLGNIALIDAAPVLFDAIEFDDAIATCDILYDLAFLLMDLWERGLRAEASFLFCRYLARSEAPLAQMEGLSALPFFLALRAAIRAKVLVAQSRLSAAADAKQEDARRYLAAALGFLAPRPAMLVAVGGFSGSGKTSLARTLAPYLGSAPGAVHLRSDVLRKAMLDVDETTPLEAASYRPEVTARLRALMEARARAALRAGYCVILDATHRHERERMEAEDLAASLGLPFLGLWLDAPPELLRLRIAARRGDASDATADVLAAQLSAGTGHLRWQRLDAAQSMAHLARAAQQLAEAAMASGAPPRQ
jgi:aminoglycoside phosphotransferase family enzyme/predicted kinase